MPRPEETKNISRISDLRRDMIESAIARNDDPFALVGQGGGKGITESEVRVVLDNMDAIHYDHRPTVGL